MSASPAGHWMVEVLAPVLQHDEQAVLTAVELALAEGWSLTVPELAWRTVSPSNRFLPASRNSLNQL